MIRRFTVLNFLLLVPVLVFSLEIEDLLKKYQAARNDERPALLEQIKSCKKMRIANNANEQLGSGIQEVHNSR